MLLPNDGSSPPRRETFLLENELKICMAVLSLFWRSNTSRNETVVQDQMVVVALVDAPAAVLVEA